MNKSVIIIVVSILVMIGGGIAYLSMNPNSTPTAQTTPKETPAPSPIAQSNEQSTSPITPGAYIDYTNDTIASTTGTKLLFFHAPWCPQCRDLETDIKKQGVPSGVTIIKVDYDTNQKLRQTYGVTIQTTFVKIDDNGKLIEKFTAYDDPSLKAVVTQLL